MSNADALRRYRLRAVAAGLCYVCRCRPHKPGRRSCQSCIDRSTAAKDSIGYKKCQSCGRPWTETLDCPECTAKNTARYRKQWDARIASGMCGRCGRSPLHPGTTMCLEHLEEM